MNPRRLFALLAALPLLGVPTLSAEEAEQPVTTLRILSYNIKHGRGMDNKVDLRRVAAVIAKSNPDLVALQEVDKNCTRSGNRDIAAELGRILGMEHRFAKFMDFQGGEYGLAVLSKLPIKESIRHPLPEGAEPRCALEVSVQRPEWPTPLSFLSIHHDWTREEIRVRQVTALLEALADHTHPIILAGDFNASRPAESLQLLEKAGWNILRKEGGEAAQWTCPSDQPGKEIDFFITRNLPAQITEHSVIDEPLASDHRPIFALLSHKP